MSHISLSSDPTHSAQLVERWRTPGWALFANKVFAKLGLPVQFAPRFDHREDMVSLEQIGNFKLLVDGVLDRGVAGDLVEMGCYTGSTTVLFGQLLAARKEARTLHAFDRFDIELGSARNIRALFEQRFRDHGVPLPAIHAGDLLSTVPAELPQRIAFAHIDLGTGGSVDEHAALVLHALKAIYPRLSSGAVVVLMDYHVPGRTLLGNDSNPGMLVACETFFKDHPERVQLLYGGPCSHAYFRKQ